MHANGPVIQTEKNFKKSENAISSLSSFPFMMSIFRCDLVTPGLRRPAFSSCGAPEPEQDTQKGAKRTLIGQERGD